MKPHQLCKQCNAWMLDHTLIGWRRCPSCNYRVKKEKAMISITELNPKNYVLDSDETDNINSLLEKINKVRTLYAKPMIVTSGFRSLQDHLRIYADKGITDIKKIPMASRHLYGEAVDISDPDGKLAEWTKNNVAALEEIGLWCEDLAHTKGWVHYQIVAPKSGNRFFIP